MPEYPVGSTEQLMGVVGEAHDLLQELSTAKATLASYQDTAALYQQKVVEQQAHVLSVMSQLSQVSDVYVTTYLGWNPKTDTPPADAPVEPTA